MTSYYQKNREVILQKSKEKRISDETQGSVYRLYLDDGSSYVGSTKMIPEIRHRLHISGYKRYQLGLGAYCSAFILFTKGDPKFEVLETTPVGQLGLREKHWAEQFPLIVNKNRIGQMVKSNPLEYYRQWIDDRCPTKVLQREFKRMAKISC